jgi:CRISPR-associated endonuclease Csn1
MDILKYRLWEELGANSAGRYCIYCGKPISAHQLFNGDAEIEHILPFSRTLKNNRNNLTIAHKWCNALKGNRTPFEAFAENPLDYSWADIETRVQDVFRYNFAKKNAFLKTDLEEALMNESSFLESQITDTAFIAKAAKEYLSCIVPPQKIMVTPGRLTSLLRAKWGLNSILSSAYDEKNRADHRHHAIDAIVIGLTTRSTLQRFATANAHGAAEKIMPPSFPIDRNWLEKRLASMLISYKPDHGIGGALFDETAYGFKVDPANPDRKPSEYYVRKPIGSLTWNIVDNGDILNNWARETIHDFLCEKQLSSKNSDNKKLSLAMQELSKISGIQSVKIRAKNAEGYKILLAGTNGRQGHKAYQKGDILCVDIWRIPKKSKKGFEFKGIYTSRADAHANGGIIVKHRPHPAACVSTRMI